MSKKTSLTEHIARNLGSLLLVFSVIMTVTFAITWSPGDAPGAVPGEGNVESPSVWEVDGASIFYSSGDVGVGTTAPATKLDIYGGDVVTATGISNGVDLVSLGEDNPSYGNDQFFKTKLWFTLLGGQVAPMLSLMQNDTDIITFEGFQYNGTGNIGIGTTTPTETLQVVDGNDGILKIGEDAGSNAQLCLNGDCFTGSDLLAGSGSAWGDCIGGTATWSGYSDWCCPSGYVLVHHVAEMQAVGFANRAFGDYVDQHKTWRLSASCGRGYYTYRASGTTRSIQVSYLCCR